MKQLPRQSVAALFCALAAASAQANVANGNLWIVPEAVAQSATLANVPGTPADVTFSVNTPFDFTSASGYSIGQFLASSSAFDVVDHNGSALGASMDANGMGTLISFTGTVTVTTGQQFTITHDDGLTLVIGGVDLNANPGPTAPVTSVYTYTGASGNMPFQLVYGECCGAPARLQVDLPLQAVPEPQSYALLGAGLLAIVGWRRRRDR